MAIWSLSCGSTWSKLRTEENLISFHRPMPPLHRPCCGRRMKEVNPFYRISYRWSISCRRIFRRWLIPIYSRTCDDADCLLYIVNQSSSLQRGSELTTERGVWKAQDWTTTNRAVKWGTTNSSAQQSHTVTWTAGLQEAPALKLHNDV